ncbi:hypothetical protein [Liquorilactobacillus sicerae]|uniref:hypothetical protein n=1 Tax=Liquorilactobacillus sicerae TaxID=1416943 RepID=UPI0024811318|nr:hypothetical protein [Liquorilactobacillus sicerae]
MMRMVPYFSFTIFKMYNKIIIGNYGREGFIISRYKVGAGKDTWDFASAYEQMQAGDTIEFEKDFVLTGTDNSYYTIKKILIWLVLLMRTIIIEHF